MLGVPGVRPSAVEQSASKAAGLQPGEKTHNRKYILIHSRSFISSSSKEDVLLNEA